MGLLLPLPFPPPIAAGLGFVGALIAIACPGHRRWLIPLLLMGTGWLRSDLAAGASAADTIDQLLARPRETITVRGLIVSDPEFRLYDLSPDGIGTYRFRLRVASIHRLKHPQPASGEVTCRWRAETLDRPPRYGDVWAFTGVVDRGDGNSARVRRGRASMWVHPDTATRLAVDRGNPVIAACLRGRTFCARLLARGIEAYPRESAVLQALMLGYRSALPEEIERMFRFTGTLHVFAVSGLHVGMFTLLMTGLFRTLGIASDRWVVLLLPLVGFYVVATGMKASTVRAGVMALVYGSAWLLRRRPDAPSSLALAACLIVAWRPAELLAPGFILSFAAVAGLLGVVPILDRPVRSRLRSDPWRIDPEPRVRRWARNGASYLASVAVLSLACWLVTFPLIAQYFNTVTPVALLSNLIVVPGAVMLVFTGCLSLITGMFSGLLAEVFNHANRIFVSLLLSAVSLLAEFPGSHRQVPSPGWTLVGVWYGMLIVWRTSAGHWRTTAGVGLTALFAVGLWWYPVRTDSRISALDGDGTVTLHVDDGARRHVLFDPGPPSGPIHAYLRRSGVSRLEDLILTRCRYETAGATPDLVRTLSIRRIGLCSHQGDEALLRRILTAAHARSVDVRILQPGDAFTVGPMTRWSVLSTRATAQGVEPCLFRIRMGPIRILLMTRTGRSLEYAWCREVDRPQAETLIIGDPGPSGPLYDKWLARIDPYAVLASQRRIQTVRYGLPALAAAAEAAGRSVLLTPPDGGLRLVVRRGRRVGDTTWRPFKSAR